MISEQGGKPSVDQFQFQRVSRTGMQLGRHVQPLQFNAISQVIPYVVEYVPCHLLSAFSFEITVGYGHSVFSQRIFMDESLFPYHHRVFRRIVFIEGTVCMLLFVIMYHVQRSEVL